MAVHAEMTRTLRERDPAAYCALLAQALEVKVTKAQLIARLGAENPQLTREEAQRVVTCLLACIEDGLLQGRRVELRGFGAFGVRLRLARQALNPKTGETVEVPTKATAFFRAGKVLNGRLNGRLVREGAAGPRGAEPGGAT